MTETYKRLGAVDPVINTNTQLYVVPTSTSTIVSSINICNRGSASAKVQLAHVDGAIGVVANEDYILYDLTIAANDFLNLTIGEAMSAADTLLVRTDTATVSFIASGVEVT